jgi:hypothetical protein
MATTKLVIGSHNGTVGMVPSPCNQAGRNSIARAQRSQWHPEFGTHARAISRFLDLAFLP